MSFSNRFKRPEAHLKEVVDLWIGENAAAWESGRRAQPRGLPRGYSSLPLGEFAPVHASALQFKTRPINVPSEASYPGAS